MIGRGALANPFLPWQLKGNKRPADHVAILHGFHNNLFELYGERLAGGGHLLGRMKGLWFYMAHYFSNGQKFLKQIQKTKDIQRYQQLITDFFSSAPACSQE